MSTTVSELYERARARQSGIGYSWSVADVAKDPDTLVRCLIENPISVIERLFALNEKYLKADAEYSAYEIEVTKRIADERAAMRRDVVALQIATEDMDHAIEVYAEWVAKKVQEARAYAAQIENAQRLILETASTELAEDRAIAAIAEVDARIILEAVERSFVEVEIARTNLEVAQARVRVILANINVTEAQLETTRALVEQAMTQVKEMDLRARIATSFADTVVRQLVKTNYEVTKAEIEAGFTFIEERLAAVLELAGLRETQENIRATLEAAFQVGVSDEQTLQMREELLRKSDVEVDERVLDYDKEKTEEGLIAEDGSLTTLAELEKTGAEVEMANQIEESGSTLGGRSWAQTEILDPAEIAVTRQRTINTWANTFLHEWIRKEG